jgi:hypothetical protein
MYWGLSLRGSVNPFRAETTFKSVVDAGFGGERLQPSGSVSTVPPKLWVNVPPEKLPLKTKLPHEVAASQHNGTPMDTNRKVIRRAPFENGIFWLVAYAKSI